MKRFFTVLMTVIATSLMASTISAQEETKEPTAEEVAAKETTRLENLLKLEDWQVFYVDSTLQHDIGAMKDEMKAMQDAKYDNYDMYIRVSDKWCQKSYDTFKKLFTEAQWKAYLKSGAERQQKARDKRAAQQGDIKK